MGGGSKARSASHGHVADAAAAATAAARCPIEIEMKIESPPLVSYGAPQDSSGALLSGIISVRKHVDSPVVLKMFKMRLLQDTTTLKPLNMRCTHCTTSTTEVRVWSLVSQPREMMASNDIMGFPFSHLLAGGLPASMRSRLATVSYRLEAVLERASTTDDLHHHPPLTFTRTLPLARSILKSGFKQSQRIFPPTSLIATAFLPHVIYPNQMDIPVDLVVGGLYINPKLRWSIRRVNWRVDELAKVIFPVCPQHANLVPSTAVIENGGLLYQDVRQLTCGDLRSGWEILSLDEADDGDVTKTQARMTLHVSTMSAECNMDSDKVSVSHAFVIEIVVGEENFHPAVVRAKTVLQPEGKWQSSGAARVLRMTYNLIVTARGGLGISWDEEIPPKYDDIASNTPPPFDRIAPLRNSNGSPTPTEANVQAVMGIRVSLSPDGSDAHRHSPNESEAGRTDYWQNNAAWVMYNHRSLTPPPAVLRHGKYEYR